MKVNLKKMGAIVAGATILASSAAFAGLMFGSTTLVDSNGAPVAKVVIGSNAQASDGVAAALIASTIASNTFKSSTLTANVAGAATCAVGTGSASGGCQVSNKQAKLEITVPGSVASGTATVGNLIGDLLNRKLEDRVSNAVASTANAYAMGSDTSENANPFTDGVSSNIGPSETFMYRVDGNQFSPFATATLTDKESATSFKEQQALWIKGYNKYSTSEKEVTGTMNFLAYSLKFDGPGTSTLGIPVCSQSTNGDYANCTDDYKTSTHKLSVWFLGEPWIISEMSSSGVAANASESKVNNGGYIKLAKESVSGILNAGDNLAVDDLKFQLDDLEAHGDTTSAIISIVDANGNVLKKDKVSQDTTKEITINGKTYNFHVYKVAPGYTFGAKWADVAIFKDELKLEDSQKLDSDKAKNDQYNVALGWKTKSGSADADHLRTVVIYADSLSDLGSAGSDELHAGEYFPIVQSPAPWKLSYKGLDLTSSDMKSLKFEIKSSDLSISDSKGPTFAGSQVACTVYAPYVKVTSGDTGSVFAIDSRSDGLSGSLSDKEFLVALSNVTSDVGALCGAVNVPTGSVLMRESSNGDYGLKNYTTNGVSVKYSAIGDGDTNMTPGVTGGSGGMILVENSGDIGNTIGMFQEGRIGQILNYSGYLGYSGNHPDYMFLIAEKAGTGDSNGYVDYYMFGMDQPNSASGATYDFASTDGSTHSFSSDSNKILYQHATSNTTLSYVGGGPVNSGIEMVDEGYVSERGSVFKSVSSTSVDFSMANNLARAQWYLASSDASTASSSANVVTLGEGETSPSYNGVTVKVLGITETVGACSAAGAASACTVDMAPVSAVIMPNNAPSVTVATPYTGSYGNLVILDSDAVGVNTLVSVGGDKVNSVTASLLQGSAVDWTATPKVVKEVVQGSKIVVAGAQAADTLSAAQDFVSQVKKV